MINTRLAEFQKIIFASKAALFERLMGVEDELGTALAYMVTVEGLPGGAI
jgi:hypothetical protein